MDPTAYSGFYSPLATAIPPGMRYPYPPTPTTTPSARTSMMYFPQPLSVSDSMSKTSATSSSSPTTPAPPDSSETPQTDKKLRRQIANSNERRRMQSINSGFHALRLLMPHLQGEKLSKASVLQHAAEHIYRLNQERERLAQQNAALRMMLSKYWAMDSKGEVCGDGKVNKATSPITLMDDEKAAAKELEDIFATRHELDVVKEELERERALRIRAEAKNRALQEQLASENETEEGSDSEYFSSHKRARTTPEPKSNLDIIVRAIRQIEGDAFSRSTTPTCASHDRTALSAFVPINSSKDSSRVSPVTPVYAS